MVGLYIFNTLTPNWEYMMCSQPLSPCTLLILSHFSSKYHLFHFFLTTFATWPMNVYDSGGQLAKVLHKNTLKRVYFKEKWESIGECRERQAASTSCIPSLESKYWKCTTLQWISTVLLASWPMNVNDFGGQLAKVFDKNTKKDNYHNNTYYQCQC